MHRVEVQPAAGELAYGDAWQLADGVTVAVTGVRVDEYETASGPVRTRLALAVAARNTSEEPFELVYEFGLLTDHGAYTRRVWVDPGKRPQALPGTQTVEPGETVTGEIYVPLELPAGGGRATFIPSFAGVVEHDCQGCGRGSHDVLPLAMWQPVAVEVERARIGRA